MAEDEHPLYAALESLEDRNSSSDYWFGVECLEQLLSTIKESPDEDRLRRFDVKEPEFHNAIGKLKGSKKLMLAAGFYMDSSAGKSLYVMDANHKSWSNLKKSIRILQKKLRHKSSKSSSKSGKSSSKSKSKSSEKKHSKESTFEEKTRKPPSRSSSGKSKHKSKRKITQDQEDEEEIRLRTAPSPFSAASDTDGDRTYFEDEPNGESASDIMQLYTDSTASSRSSPASPSDLNASFSSRGPSPTEETDTNNHRKKSKKSKKKHKSSTTQALMEARTRTNVDDADDDEVEGLIRSPTASPMQVSSEAKARAQRNLKSVASKMSAMALMEKENKPKSKRSMLNVYDDEEEESEHDGAQTVAKRWLGESSKRLQKDKPSNGSLAKTESSRSLGSSFGFSRRGLFRSSSSRSNMSKSDRKVERELSIREKREKRLMKKEEKELRQQRKQLIQERIKLEGGPRWSYLMMLVTLLTVAELGLDLGTTVISFVSLIESFDCCGQEVDAGALTLGITIPYFVLIVIELIVLAFSVREARRNTRRDAERMKGIDNLDEEWCVDDDLWDFEAEKRQCVCGRMIDYIVVANPFLGALITWALLYEVQSQMEAYIMVGLEGGSIVLMFISVWLTRESMTFCKLLYHALPLLPFAGICFVLWYYLEKGGICFRDGIFLFDACGVCPNGEPAVDGGSNCANGTVVQGTFCGEVVKEQFCYYSY